MNQSSRAECLISVAREVGVAHCECFRPDLPVERFLLVQRNIGGHPPPFWLTTHASPSAAGSYIAGEEFPEYWETVVLVDLDTGARMVEATRVVRWEPVPVTPTAPAS
jgi:hypothetical protein